jgi:hypothetical protein
MSTISESLAKGQEAKASKRLTRAEIIRYTKAIREQLHLERAVEIAIQLVKRVEGK